MQTHLIGNRRVDTALTEMVAIMPSVPFDTLAFFDLPADTAFGYIKRAADTLQREFSTLPDLARYCIVEAFRRWWVEYRSGE